MNLLISIDRLGEVSIRQGSVDHWAGQGASLAASVRHFAGGAYHLQIWSEGQLILRAGLTGFDEIRRGGTATHTIDGMSVTIQPANSEESEDLPATDQVKRLETCDECEEFLRPGCRIIRCCADGSPNKERYSLNLRLRRGTCPLSKWPV